MNVKTVYFNGVAVFFNDYDADEPNFKLCIKMIRN